MWRRRSLSAFARQTKIRHSFTLVWNKSPRLDTLVASFSAVSEIKGNGNTNSNSENNGASNNDQYNPDSCEARVVAPQSSIMLGANTVTITSAISDVGRLGVFWVGAAIATSAGSVICPDVVFIARWSPDSNIPGGDCRSGCMSAIVVIANIDQINRSRSIIISNSLIAVVARPTNGGSKNRWSIGLKILYSSSDNQLA